MAELIIMPKQGLQMTEGTITRWFAAEGDPVVQGADLFEMETDKLTITIPASHGGTLLKIIRGAGETVPITRPIAVVGAPGEAFDDLLPDEPKESASAEGTPGPSSPSATGGQAAPAPSDGFPASPRAKLRAEERGIDCSQIPGTGPEGLVVERDVLAWQPTWATPLARKVAGQAGMALAGLAGTGPRGKITAGDVRGAAEGTAIPGASRGERLVPFTGMRRRVAARMKESLHTMAQACHRLGVDMSEAVRLRERLKGAGQRVSYNDIVLRCAARALTEFPDLNATWTDEGILEKGYVNLGMAVAVEEGLLVPVIRDADLLTLPELSARAMDLAGRAKENRLEPDEYTGGTFTVSNLGMLGIDSFTAIINPPEAGILAVGRLSEQPVVREGQVVIRPMMELTLTYDHRMVDGAPAARFLARVGELLENPGLLL